MSKPPLNFHATDFDASADGAATGSAFVPRVDAPEVAGGASAGEFDASPRTGGRTESLAKLVHELRTPLHGILGMAALLLSDPELTPRQRRRLELIDYSGRHQLQLVNDILEYARLDARKVRLDARPSNLQVLLPTTVEMMRSCALDKGLMLQLLMPSDMPEYVFVDELRLRQVLLNLLSNAIKFTDIGTVVLRVDAFRKRGLESGNVWRFHFSIVDTGRGLSSEQQVQFFEMFSSEGEEHLIPNGTGVGLVVTRELVKLLGGTLELRSASGVGTSAQFELELQQVEPLDMLPVGGA